MVWRKDRYTQGIIGIPSVLIAISWIALWMVWSFNKVDVLSMRKQSDLSVSYIKNDPVGKHWYMLPDLPLRLYTDKFKRNSGEKVVTDSLLAGYLQKPELLPRIAPLTDINASYGRISLDDDFLKETMTYKLGNMTERISLKKINRDKNTYTIYSTVLGDLKKYGFKFPDIPFKIHWNKPWMIEVDVEVNDAGKVEHVFLEKGTDDKDINSLIIKTMYHGNVTESGIKCSGRVIINFGYQ